jgi:sulfite reductase alpha subunit-like flavoprotein
VIRDSSFRLKAFFQDNFATFRIFVAGNSKNMPQSVEKAIKEVFKSLTNDNLDEASDLYDKLYKEGRIQFETWN